MDRIRDLFSTDGIIMNIRHFLAKAICTGLVLLVFSGCGGNPNLAPVEGTVTMDGKPLADATVLFINAQSRPAAAKTDKNGFYRLSFSDDEPGAYIGKNIVRITTVQGVGLADDGSSIPGVKETVPIKYNARSKLEFHVQAKRTNVADFQLDSKGPVLSTE